MESGFNLEIGLAVAIMLHFGAVVWWGSKLTAEVKSMRETMTSAIKHIEIQQREIRELYTKVAVHEAITSALAQGGGTYGTARAVAATEGPGGQPSGG